MSRNSIFIKSLLEHPKIKDDNDMLKLLSELYDKAWDDLEKQYQEVVAVAGEKKAFHKFHRRYDAEDYFNYHKFEEIRKTFSVKE